MPARLFNFAGRAPGLAAVGGAAIALYDLVADAVVQSVVYGGVGAIAILSVALRARRAAGGARLGLGLVTAGLACWVAGGAFGDLLRVASGDAIPSFAGVIYPLGYALAIGGLALVAHDVLGRAPALPLIDAAIAAASFLVLASVAVDVIGTSSESAGRSLGLLAYPTMDVFALAAGARLFGGGAGPRRSLQLLGCGLVAVLCVDAAHAVDATRYTVGGALDSGWLVAYLCFALAARSRGGAPHRPAPEQLRLRPGPLVALGLLLAAAPVAAAAGSYAVDTTLEAIVAAIPCAALATLVMARMGIVLQAHDRARVARQRARPEAVEAQRVAEATRLELAAEHEPLLESGIRFREIFDHAGLAIGLVDADRTVFAVNRGAERVFGYPRDEFLAKGVTGVTHPDDVASDAEPFAELVAGMRDTYTTEKRYVRKDGTMFWGRLTYSVARREDGSVRFGIAMIEDVTAVHEAETALKDSERRLEQMFQDARIAMAVSDGKGRWVRTNAALCKLLGYSEHELRGRRFADITHPGDVENNLDALRQLLAGEIDSFEAEKRYIRRDGRVVSALINVSLIRDKATGEPLLISQIQDVTARNEALAALRESERRLRAIVENTMEGIVVVDDHRRIETANPAACSIAGRGAGELVGTRIDGLLNVPAQKVERIWTALRADGGASSVECVLGRPDGLQVALEVALVGNVLPERHLLIVRDISERLALEAERQRLDQERRIAQRLEAVGQLAAGIAHEINTPVQFIGNSVGFIGQAFDDLQSMIAAHQAALAAVQEGRPDAPELAAAALDAEDDADLPYLQERIPAAVERTRAGVDRIAAIIGAMRDFGHTGSSPHEPADVNHAVRSTLIVARHEYKYVADVETTFGDLPLVTCNVGELGQVILNLIVNAAHAIQAAAGPGGDDRGTIRIRTSQDDGTAEIAISDTGTGIPAEIQERIFDPFFTTKEPGKGTGQGLAISRSIIVDKHHGALTLDSAPGKGATFLIRLPITTPPGRRQRREAVRR